MAMKGRQAEKSYNNIIATLDKLGWKYTEYPEDNRVKFNVYGEDLSSTYYFTISAEKEMALLQVVLPYRSPREDTDGLAAAVSIANARFYNGNFEFNPKTREVSFRMSAFLNGGMVFSEECAKYMINTACDMVDKYDDKLFAVGKGYLSLTRFSEIIKN